MSNNPIKHECCSNDSGVECPDCGRKLIRNHYVAENKPPGYQRIGGLTCTNCGYEKWDE